MNIPWKDLKERLVEGEDLQELCADLEILIDSKKVSQNDRSDLYCLGAEAYLGLNNLLDAEIFYDNALIINSHNVEAYQGVGYCHWKSYRHEDAMKNFKKGLALSPNHSKCMLGVGLVYKRLGMTIDAIYWMEKSINIGVGGDVNLLIFLQTCSYCPDKQYALKAIERVKEHVGQDENLMRCLGSMHLKIGNTEKGQDILKKYPLVSVLT